MKLNYELSHEQNVSRENRGRCCLPTSALPAPGIDRVVFIGRGSIVGNKSTGILPISLELDSAIVLLHATFWSLLVAILCYIKVGNELEKLVTFAQRNGNILFHNL